MGYLVFVAACRIFSYQHVECSSLTRDPSPLQSVSHWTTKEVPIHFIFVLIFVVCFFLTFYFVLEYSQLTNYVMIVSGE